MALIIFLVSIAGGLFASLAMDRDEENRPVWKLAIACFIIGALGVVFLQTEELGEQITNLFS